MSKLNCCESPDLNFLQLKVKSKATPYEKKMVISHNPTDMCHCVAP